MSISQEDFKDLNGKVDQILKILNGNGKIGLAGKVDIMWNSTVFIVTAFCLSVFAAIKSFFGGHK